MRSGFYLSDPDGHHGFLALYMEDFKPGAVVTDIIGVKEVVFKNLGNLLRKDIDYIPGHPMAGSEKGVRRG